MYLQTFHWQSQGFDNRIISTHPKCLGCFAIMLHSINSDEIRFLLYPAKVEVLKIIHVPVALAGLSDVLR